ncbi:hypothetical protein EDC01DRAFT_634172 [Geopyxis carbonaria]|nr:hypothetical protein EDC01DRAFT_634172 [Geopyxis carbonaria]
MLRRKTIKLCPQDGHAPASSQVGPISWAPSTIGYHGCNLNKYSQNFDDSRYIENILIRQRRSYESVLQHDPSPGRRQHLRDIADEILIQEMRLRIQHMAEQEEKAAITQMMNWENISAGWEKTTDWERHDWKELKELPETFRPAGSVSRNMNIHSMISERQKKPRTASEAGNNSGKSQEKFTNERYDISEGTISFDSPGSDKAVSLNIVESLLDQELSHGWTVISSMRDTVKNGSNPGNIAAETQDDYSCGSDTTSDSEMWYEDSDSDYYSYRSDTTSDSELWYDDSDSDSDSDSEVILDNVEFASYDHQVHQTNVYQPEISHSLADDRNSDRSITRLERSMELSRKTIISSPPEGIDEGYVFVGAPAAHPAASEDFNEGISVKKGIPRR